MNGCMDGWIRSMDRRETLKETFDFHVKRPKSILCLVARNTFRMWVASSSDSSFRTNKYKKLNVLIYICTTFPTTSFFIATSYFRLKFQHHFSPSVIVSIKHFFQHQFSNQHNHANIKWTGGQHYCTFLPSLPS